MVGAAKASIEAGLELFGALVAYRRMTPPAIVPTLDVLKDRTPRLLLRGVITLINQLPFQGAEKALHGGVVITVACAAHADLNPAGLQQMPVLVAGILHPSIRVVQH